MRISIENPDSHVQAQTVKIFAQKLQERLQGRLKVEFYSGAKLFRDQNVITALAMGRVEMAVPGTWQIDKHVPVVGIFLLPVFYGRRPEAIYSVNSSPLGNMIVTSIEDELGVKVLGEWIDLGYAHVFSASRKISSFDDFDCCKIRIAGGIGNQRRIEALGAIPLSIAFPDLSEKLSQGGIDGVLTSYETIRSVELWKSGILYAFEDSEYFAQYVPIVSIDFWNQLTPDIQKIIVDTWQEGVPEARMNAEKSQNEAKEIFLQQGGEVFIPTDLELAVIRSKLMKESGAIAKDIGISDEVLEKLEEFFEKW